MNPEDEVPFHMGAALTEEFSEKIPMIRSDNGTFAVTVVLTLQILEDQTKNGDCIDDISYNRTGK